MDIDAEEGRKVEAVFDKEYGEGMAKFVECDVADSKKFEGIIFYLVYWLLINNDDYHCNFDGDFVRVFWWCFPVRMVRMVSLCSCWLWRYFWL